MKTNLARSPWIIPLFAVAAVVAYVHILFLPGERSIAGTREEVTAAGEFVERVRALGPAVEATRKQLDGAQQYVARWERSALPEAGLSGVFGRIAQLAKESGITTTRFEPQSAIAYDRVRRLPVALTCVGSFAQVSEFLRALECLEQTVWVEALQMQRSGEDSESVQCELTLAIFDDNPGDSDQVNRSE
jgi:Tfp pilus assembly protein PilO